MTLTGKTINRYWIIEQLGQGGMAVVYKAFDTRLERDVAIKVIRTDNILPRELEHFLKRFEREAKTQSKFNHPNIVSIYDYGEFEDAPYLVMAYSPGGTLRDLTGKPMPYPQAAALLAPIADAVAYAHEKNVLHRDIKPSNILIGEKGIPTLTDFGIAKLLGEMDAATLTSPGLGVGTPQYMAPEQWRGNPVKATDTYALGVVFYELITGRKPYDAETPTALAIIQATEPLPRPTNFIPDLPDHVEKVIFKALAPQPQDRYPSMSAFAAVLAKLGNEKAQAVSSSANLTPTQVETIADLDAIPPNPAQPVVPTHYPKAKETEIDADITQDLGVDKAILPESKPKFKLPTWGWGLIGLVLAAGILFGATQFDFGGTPTETAVPVPVTEQAEEPIPTAVILGGKEVIAYSTNKSGNQDIWLVTTDGTEQLQLTDDPADDWQPSWSPDGSKIVFASERDGSTNIWVMNADGSDQTQLTDDSADDWQPSWSPDGTQIVFTSKRSGNNDVWLMNADGTNPTRLTSDSAIDWQPSWSPDSKKIIFVSDRSGNPDIWLTNLSGSSVVQLSNNQGDDFYPYFTPDGENIIFTSNRGGVYNIWQMDSAGSSIKQITFSSLADWYTTWSPNGNQMAFYTLRSGNWEIWKMDRDGENAEQITDNQANSRYPAWRPIP